MPSKTRLAHTLTDEGGGAGFHFLGFDVRPFPKGTYRCGRHVGKPLGFKTLIRPSTEKVLRHYRRLAGIVRRMSAAPQRP